MRILRTRDLLTLSAAVAALTLMSAAPLVAQADTGESLDETFAMMDADGNGRITSGEYKDYSDRYFKMMDHNSDGSVTKEEMKLAEQKMQGNKK